MAKIDAVDIPKLLFTEGAAPGTPAASKVHLYAKADGLLYSKDDAGAESAVSGTGSAGVASGTSFPGSPANNDLFYRTDRDLLYFYDGTRWLTTTLYESLLTWSTAGVSSDAAQSYYPVDGTYGMFIVELIASTFVPTTNNGSNFWEVELRWVNSAATETELGNCSTVADTAGVWTRHTTAINAVLDATARVLLTRADETGSAGNLSYGASMRWRLIG